MVGRELSKYLSSRHHLTLLTRVSNQNLGDSKELITWQQLTEDNIVKYDIIINVCGYNIGQKRRTKAVKYIILTSRIEPNN
ncbi:epimerase, partial [Francisella tularensis subsp. holarctica]|nr:epimerase [Francisella tularensis subsp. holarctica]